MDDAPAPMCFKDVETDRQSEFKRTSGYFSPEAQADGVYLRSVRPGRVMPVPYCVPVPHSPENIFFEIREQALAYFASRDIEWHDQTPGRKPSNHLRDSQVCCVNCLFPFATRPDALADLLRPVFPTLQRMLPIDGDDRYLAFEWISTQDYLHDSLPGLPRRRGKGCTSSDSAVLFEVQGGQREAALLDWKYTETCDGKPLHVSPAGRDRVAIYRPFFDHSDCPFNKAVVKGFDDLFYAPFDQLMRLQFLAHEMERAEEFGVKRVTVVHITPAANAQAATVTSPVLRTLGKTAIDVWRQIVRLPDRFVAVPTEDLFGAFPLRKYKNLESWWTYITARYSWIMPKS